MEKIRPMVVSFRSTKQVFDVDYYNKNENFRIFYVCATLLAKVEKQFPNFFTQQHHSNRLDI